MQSRIRICLICSNDFAEICVNYKDYCSRKEFSEENLMFWTACEAAKTLEDDQEFLQQVRDPDSDEIIEDTDP